jgi:GR25 family glycosyltransferase involved in LPS biosynthesis
MDCIYINLDAQTGRRRQIEASFATQRGEGWTLARQPAISAEDLADDAVPGPLRPAERACILSHCLALATAAASDRPTLILEDDAVFARDACRIMDQVLDRTEAGDWDLLFTDLCVANIGMMSELILRRRRLARTGQIELINLQRWNFAGATAYIVSPRCAAAILARVEATTVHETPFDLILRAMIWEGALKGLAIFPFITSVTHAANTSTIQVNADNSPELIWNLFRRMAWIDRDLAAEKAAVDRLDRDFGDDEVRAFGVLFATLASGKLRTK